MPCGTERIVGIVKGLDGVTSANYNAANSMLTVNFDPVSASAIDIQLELSVNGYDAGDFSHDAGMKLPDCARSGGGMRGDQATPTTDELGELGIDDIDGLEGDTDWENPDAFELVGTSGDDDIDILDEEEEEDDLSSFLGEDDDDPAPVVEDPSGSEEDDDDSDD